MKMLSLIALQSNIFKQYILLTKPKVTQLSVFCAAIGMFLSAPGIPSLDRLFFGITGIWLMAAAAFSINCLLERKTDKKMIRTLYRTSIFKKISNAKVICFSIFFSIAGASILYYFVNKLTMFLTTATFLGYVLIYTLFLKPRTPQNIVIGGLSGAMPPALGWSAISGSLSPEAWTLVLIIFVWTPPHFWSLALYRSNDYLKSKWPMLPITHGTRFTTLQILLYSIILTTSSIFPYIIQMSGIFYLTTSIILDFIFIFHSWKLYKAYSEKLAKQLFRFSVIYLSLLFFSLLLDHWIYFMINPDSTCFMEFFYAET